MKKIFSLIAFTFGATVLANGLFSTSAHAQAVTGRVKINAVVPDIVFLETYTEITFNMNAANLTSSTSGLIQTPAQGGPGEGTVAAGDNKVNPPFLATTSAQTSTIFPGVLVYRTWGIGGPDGQIKHSAKLTSNTLRSTDPNSFMTLTAEKAEVTQDAPGLDSTNALPGAMDFTFDLNNVKKSGTYTGAELMVSAVGV